MKVNEFIKALIDKGICVDLIKPKEVNKITYATIPSYEGNVSDVNEYLLNGRVLMLLNFDKDLYVTSVSLWYSQQYLNCYSRAKNIFKTNIYNDLYLRQNLTSSYSIGSLELFKHYRKGSIVICHNGNYSECTYKNYILYFAHQSIEMIEDALKHVAKGELLCSHCGRWFNPREEEWCNSSFAGSVCKDCLSFAEPIDTRGD